MSAHDSLLQEERFSVTPPGRPICVYLRPSAVAWLLAFAPHGNQSPTSGQGIFPPFSSLPRLSAHGSRLPSWLLPPCPSAHTTLQKHLRRSPSPCKR
jgi:hypothetical protein